MILSVGIKYYVPDLIYDVNNYRVAQKSKPLPNDQKSRIKSY